jgi:hypothetical protein
MPFSLPPIHICLLNVDLNRGSDSETIYAIKSEPYSEGGFQIKDLHRPHLQMCNFPPYK